jgi:YVTN family beta-propeller protein
MQRMCFLTALAFCGFTAAASAGSSNSLMDVSPDGKLLLVANTDNGTVNVIDAAKKAVLREIAVGAKPEGVTWIGQGPRAAVTLYAGNQVVFFDAATGQVSKKLPVNAEPYGIVADAEGRRAWVTHEYPGIVSEIDLAREEVIREIPAGSHVRGIAYNPNDQRLYVSEFFTGVLRAIDIASGKEVDSWKGRSTDNLSRHVLVHPKRPKAYLAHIRSIVNFIDGAGSIFPYLSICDLKPGADKPGADRRRVSFGMDTFNGVYVVTNPWETAISPDGKKLYLIYAGTNDMNFCNVIDDDYREVSPVGPAVRIGQNPRAVRVSPDSQTVYIYNAMDFAVSVHQASTMRNLGTIKTCAPPKTPEWVLGKVLFNTANAPMTSRRWIACSSCHPDGLHDARVWQNPEGLRKTTALMGMAHTHPLHWSADRDEVQDFEYTIRSKLMGGRGLIQGPIHGKKGFEKAELDYQCGGKSKELDALAIYCNSFETPLSPHAAAPGKLTPAAERGQAIFFRKDVACASCHSGPYFTDSSLQKPYKLHDVGTGREDKSEKMGPLYDTPTLIGVYRTAPYLHHGKARTLLDVVTTCNPGDKHGKTSHLAKTELADLVEFLKSLPYEPLPALTPNTVEYRLQAVTPKP